MHRRSLEWAGGRALMPAYVMEGEPFRPEVILWCEAPQGLIVRSDVVDPRHPVSFAASLEAAMTGPMFGSPRRPQRVRVASADLAAEIRAAHPEIDVVVARTPEFDEAMSALSRSMCADSEESHLDDGRIPEAAVARLFRAAEILWTAAPWKRAFDSQVLRVDLPSFGVRGACLSIIGALGESFGFLLFPSLDAFEAFGALTSLPKKEPVDLGTSFLSLDFERGAALPQSLRREISRHDWPLAGPDAYPRLRRVDRDAALAPLIEKDYRLAAAIATSLVAFFAKRGPLPELDDDFEPISESWFDDDDLEVRFTYPYEAFELFEPAASPPRLSVPAPAKIGRNAPCPCGSGKKYKKCCLGKSESPPPPDPRARCHEMDERLVTDMVRYARRRFGSSWAEGITRLLPADETLQLVVPFSVYGHAVDGRPIVEWFLEKPGRSLASEERAWLEAQRRAWLGVWEVSAVEPGTGVTVVDLLSGEERRVLEVSGSKVMARRDTVLGRVVDHDGISVFCGMHSRPLSPLDASEVVENTRSRLRRKGRIAVERLREEKITRHLIERWEDAVAERDERHRVPPTLANTDGDAILLTIDHFAFAPGDRAEVVRRIAALEDVDVEEEGSGRASYAFVGTARGALQSPILGRLEVLAAGLRLETNSVRRADDLRARIETACGALVRHRVREHSDPRSLLDRDEPPAPREDAIPADVQARLLRDFKASHYARWVDEPLPALNGETPRNHVRTKSGRRRVDTLLREMENYEARLPEAERFDFSAIRTRLGLPP